VLRAGTRAARELRDIADGFVADGYRIADDGERFRLERDGATPVCVGMARQGRIFGGSYPLEISTAEPVLPKTHGLRGRPRGVVRLGGIDFHARSGDQIGRMLAARLERDERLQRALADVHFDRIRVEPDGRATIRHVGGGVVWMLFPPLVRPIPFIPEQRRATLAALEAFAAIEENPRSLQG